MGRLIDFLERNQATCLNKRLFGVECPGCGMQRALIALLRGNLAESFALYPPLLPILAMLFFLGLHLVFRFRNGALVLRVAFVVNVLLVLANYLYKVL